MPRSTASGNAAACAFCEIVAGQAAAALVLDETDAVAFLDRRPLFFGHVLLVPRDHHETLLDLPAASVGPLFAAVQRLARAVTDAMGSDGTFVAMNNVVSQSVAHLHIHVVPRRRGDGLRGFFWPRQRYTDDAAMAEVAARIAARVAPGPFVGDDVATSPPACAKESS